MGNNEFNALKMSILWLLLIFLFLASIALAQNKKDYELSKSNNSVNAEPSMVKFNINNISTFIYADGRADVNGANCGFEYPKGSNKYCVYESGFLFAGRRDSQEIRLGGSTYPSGMVPGRILDDCDNRIYRVRPDWQHGSIQSEINDNEKNGDEFSIRFQYKLDWYEWPWQREAPYLDADGNGRYDPDPDGNQVYDIGEDIPGVPGSDQTIYFIANNADRDKSRQFLGSPPTNFEMHLTIWGYRSGSAYPNMLFKRYRLINKDNVKYNECFIGVWSDPDLGNAGDDYVGCDTLLNLGYVYNAYDEDTVYGNNPPASGHVLLSIPANEHQSGQMMTAFAYFVPYLPNPYGEDEYGNYNTGTLYFYNLMRGRIPSTGELFPIPPEVGGGVTKFNLSGDPVTGFGFVDGIIKPPMDRKYLISSGPFTICSGESKDFVIAQLSAGGNSGVDRLQAITLLRKYAKQAQVFANTNFQFLKPQLTNSIQSTTEEGNIKLEWSSDAESYSLDGYEFQGYNIYQLPYSNAPISEGVKIKTFDKVDGIKVITEEYFEDDHILTRVAQTGNDWGIEHELEIDRDYLRNTDLHLGNDYHYAVTNYNYCPVPWGGSSTFESEPISVTAILGENDEYDIDKINVFPNPYYGANPNELNKYQRYVTFSHLPEQATIRIFNLAGHLIRTIYKTEPGQFQRWDLMNEHGWQAPAGIYIAYIEMPQLGKIKLLKLAIIPERIVPDYY